MTKLKLEYPPEHGVDDCKGVDVAVGVLVAVPVAVGVSVGVLVGFVVRVALRLFANCGICPTDANDGTMTAPNNPAKSRSANSVRNKSFLPIISLILSKKHQIV